MYNIIQYMFCTSYKATMKWTMKYNTQWIIYFLSTGTAAEIRARVSIYSNSQVPDVGVVNSTSTTILVNITIIVPVSEEIVGVDKEWYEFNIKNGTYITLILHKVLFNLNY